VVGEGFHPFLPAEEGGSGKFVRKEGGTKKRGTIAGQLAKGGGEKKGGENGVKPAAGGMNVRGKKGGDRLRSNWLKKQREGKRWPTVGGSLFSLFSRSIETIRIPL